MTAIVSRSRKRRDYAWRVFHARHVLRQGTPAGAECRDTRFLTPSLTMSSLESPGVTSNPLSVFGEGGVRLLRERPLGFEDAEVLLEFRPRLRRGERHGDRRVLKNEPVPVRGPGG